MAKMCRIAAVAGVLVLLAGLVSGNMNGQPGQYKIANGNPGATGATYSTDYKAEYFEVYSQPIKTRYSEVYWRMQEAVPLPPEIKERFADKVMAIVGFEVNQVRVTPTGDIPVPITWAYNHHFVAWLANSKKVKFTKQKADPHGPHRGLYHGAQEQWLPELLKKGDEELEHPAFSEDMYWQVFSEANGGEFRMSYHGYPNGYAQLVQGPDEFLLTPMQIDTWNRDMAGAKFMPGPLPKSSRIPASAGYSGLIECPCSDRLPSKWEPAYALQGSSSCKGDVASASECFSGARQVVPGAKSYAERSVADAAQHKGCSITVDEQGAVTALWNSATAASSSSSSTDAAHVLGTPGPKPQAAVKVAFAQAEANVTVALASVEGPAAVRITLVGPADKWFGVGFGATSMCVKMEADECEGGGPYAIIVSGDQATERRLDFHGPGRELERSFKVEESSVIGGRRKIVLTRTLKGKSSSHLTFDPVSSLRACYAMPSTDRAYAATRKGCTLEFAQHCGHAPAMLNFLPAGEQTGVCDAGIRGWIGGNAFYQGRCAPYPKSELGTQGNPTCDVRTYKGGLSCCRDGESLLDVGQEIPWAEVLEYHLKFRFYFEEFRPPTLHAGPSHVDLVRVYWQTEAWAGEYDIVQCPPEVPRSQCVQQISSRWQVKDMLPQQASADPAKISGIRLIYAGPHCHAPSCLSMELYNADTGQLLCSVSPLFGQSHAVLDESGYIAIPPCLWGDPAEGLVAPQLLGLETTLLSIKKNNNSLPHTGEMASWQMRAAVVPATMAGTPATMAGRPPAPPVRDGNEGVVVLSRGAQGVGGPHVP